MRRWASTAVLISKLDGDARGGAALSVQGRHRQAHQILSAPAKSWMTLEPFHPDRMASRIAGHGRYAHAD